MSSSGKGRWEVFVTERVVAITSQQRWWGVRSLSMEVWAWFQASPAIYFVFLRAQSVARSASPGPGILPDASLQRANYEVEVALREHMARSVILGHVDDGRVWGRTCPEVSSRSRSSCDAFHIYARDLASKFEPEHGRGYSLNDMLRVEWRFGGRIGSRNQAARHSGDA